MSTSQAKLNECLSQATLHNETFSTELTAARRNALLDDDTGKLLTSLSECVGAQLEALKLLADETKSSRT
jgi:hypothetical protein